MSEKIDINEVAKKSLAIELCLIDISTAVEYHVDINDIPATRKAELEAAIIALRDKIIRESL